MIDLHLHTTASDGTSTPSELVSQARSAGLSIFSITDHDTTSGLDAASVPARDAGLQLIAGIEITAVAGGRDVHMLGYFIDPATPRLRDFLLQQREDRLRRVHEIGARLAELGAPVDVGPIAADAARGRSVGRPQIADALIAAGHVGDRDEAFARFLQAGGPAFVPRRGASPEAVIALIHDAGGLASLAHPGVTRRDDLLPALAAAGLDALEAVHADHDPASEARYRDLARTLGILVTGGSDFHGADAGHRVNALGQVTLPAEDFARLRAAAGR
ncbi:MAG TPA: PHP domain-containing protein [Vicinamibacterales bacterium]|nr:PHP domain-containing protein [Vicinamibacterales bacterium]